MGQEEPEDRPVSRRRTAPPAGLGLDSGRAEAMLQKNTKTEWQKLNKKGVLNHVDMTNKCHHSHSVNNRNPLPKLGVDWGKTYNQF